MEIVSSLEEIRHNLITVERYIGSDNPATRDAMYTLISAGKNFVAYRVGREYHFAPSRFVGYKDNTLRKHDDNETKHGSKTSGRLRKAYMLGQDLPNDELEIMLDSSCKAAGHELARKKHTFWIIDRDFEMDVDQSFIDSEFEEGKEIERIHGSHERNTKMIRLTKAKYIAKNGSVCQVCNFDFEKAYGAVGIGFIEAHHTVPVCELKDGDMTQVKDIAFVCANCHRMIHRYPEWLSMEKLSRILK